MKNKMQNTNKKPSGIKTILGAITALGIFASLMWLSNPELQTQIQQYLKADIDQATNEAIITNQEPKTNDQTPNINSITPTTGKTEDQIYITVQNWEGFSEYETSIFFGETPGTISAIGESGENQTMIVAEVPQLNEAKEYSIKITTPTGMLESKTKFTLTEPSEIIEPEIVNSEYDIYDQELTTINHEPIVNQELTMMQNIEHQDTEEKLEITINQQSNGIQLTWDKPKNTIIANYNIYYGSQSKNYIHSITTNNATALIKNLAKGKMYFFQVRAIDTLGNESATSNEVSAIFSPTQAPQITEPIFHPASPKPPILSEEGPAETLLISLIIACLFSIFAWKKLFAI
jgi:hypothetical protein